MKRNTTPEKLLDAINNKKLSVIGGKIYSVDMVRNYPPDQFVEELEFLCESGCFAEMIDIKYEVAVGHVLLDIQNGEILCLFMHNMIDLCSLMRCIAPLGDLSIIP